MRLRLVPVAAGLVLSALTLPAYGINCYQIWNSQDVLVYQSSVPPFDLAAPAFDRSMASLRARRGTFIFFDTTGCARVGGAVAGSGQPSPDPASLLVDVRSGPSTVPRGAMLSPVPASAGAPPPGVPLMGTMNSIPSTPTTGMGTNIRAPSRY